MNLYFAEEALLNAEYYLPIANASLITGYGSWIKYLNTYLASFKQLPLELIKSDRSNSESILHILQASQSLKSVNGPLVSICVSCFNASEFIQMSMRSLFKQTYKNIEIIAFNDKSEDDTLTVLNQLALEDKRLTVINNVSNQGTYISRNQAFSMASGKYFTILDADDFALPERIAIQVAQLESNQNHMGVLGEWIRLEKNGRFVWKNLFGDGYKHEAVATLMVRTKEVRQKVGFWDSVRIAADTEFFIRLRHVFGKENIPKIKVPLVLSLFHESSLTRNSETGISVGSMKGLSPTRLEYRDSWKRWHEVSGDTLFMPFPLNARKFPAPQVMLP
jgi:glycosyltransferase involved in cell wall biosynthesis